MDLGLELQCWLLSLLASLKIPDSPASIVSLTKLVKSFTSVSSQPDTPVFVRLECLILMCSSAKRGNSMALHNGKPSSSLGLNPHRNSVHGCLTAFKETFKLSSAPKSLLSLAPTLLHLYILVPPTDVTRKSHSLLLTAPISVPGIQAR